MKIINLAENNSLLNTIIRELRDINIQSDSMRFRRNLERAGEIVGYELSKTLNYSTERITTPISDIDIPVISDKIVLATILRAGIPFHNGLLNIFDRAECSFITAHRIEKEGNNDISVELNYATTAPLEGKVLIIADTMLATGMSMLKSYNCLVEKGGKPVHTHIVSVLAAQDGIDYLVKNLPSDSFTIWTVTIDPRLTAAAYIDPGLGDAGDLAYGKKI